MPRILDVIGSNIRHYRNALRLSQESLAEKAGLHRTYIGAVERGDRNVSAQNIARIAGALGIEPFVLMKERRQR